MFFVEDPDTDKFDGGADPEVNEEGKDNYLVSRDWFLEANLRDESYPVRGMTRELFRKSPTQALFDFANAITNEGRFDEAQQAWFNANREWLDVYGKEEMRLPWTTPDVLSGGS